jgi:hypothetical protein
VLPGAALAPSARRGGQAAVRARRRRPVANDAGVRRYTTARSGGPDAPSARPSASSDAHTSSRKAALGGTTAEGGACVVAEAASEAEADAEASAWPSASCDALCSASRSASVSHAGALLLVDAVSCVAARARRRRRACAHAAARRGGGGAKSARRADAGAARTPLRPVVLQQPADAARATAAAAPPSMAGGRARAQASKRGGEGVEGLRVIVARAQRA